MMKELRFPWLNDVVAGLVVFLVALPLCLGIALASNAPVMSGVLAGIIGGIVVGALSGSSTSVSGPAAGLTAVVASQITALGSFEIFLVALIIAGLLQIGFGLLKGGFIAAFFPSSVIKGLLAAIGIILVLKQLPHLVGWDADINGEMAFWQPDDENTFSELAKMFLHVDNGATLIGFLSLLVLLSWNRLGDSLKLKIPAPLVVVALAIGVSAFLPFLGESWRLESKHLVQVPVSESLSAISNFFRWPDFSHLLSPTVYLSGLVIALVASLETLLNLEAVDKIDPRQRVSPPNRELVAQGIANTFLGFIGGLPVTSVIIRGSVNINAGARSKVSAISHGVFLALCVMLFATHLNVIPLSCLAAILISTGLKLANEKIALQMYKRGIDQFLPFCATVLAIVFGDLLFGVGVGLLTSAFFILRSNVKRPLSSVEEQHFGHKVLRVVLANQVSFLNKAALQRTLASLGPGDHVVLDGSHTDYIDVDILDLIMDFRDTTAPARQIKVSVVGFKDEHEIENEVRYVEHSTDAVQRSLSPRQVLQMLKDGNGRVRTGTRLRRDFGKQISATSAGQFPLGVFLSCMDSRASVELIFDLGIGDVFSTRIAGHVISEKVLGSLEYACAIAGAKLIVVMGHTRCGAVSAAIESFTSHSALADETGCQHLEVLVHDIQKVVSRSSSTTMGERGTAQRVEFEDRIVRENVTDCMSSILQQSSMLRSLIHDGRIAMVGCVYNVTDGSVDFIREINHQEPSEQPERVSVSNETPVFA